MGKRRNRKNSDKASVEIRGAVTEKPCSGNDSGGVSGTRPFWLSLVLVAILNFFIFSSLSYNLWAPVYIAVPFASAFISAFLMPADKRGAVAVIFTAIAGSVIFAGGPGDPQEMSTPHLVIKHLLAQRQAQMLSYTPPLLLGLLGGILGWGMSVLVRGSLLWTKIAAWVLLILFCINFAGICMDMNPAVVDRVLKRPVEGEYNNFNSVNLLTFYYMKEGHGFYQAYSKAFSGRAENPGLKPGQIWNWRMPAVFYLWKTLLPPDGFFVMYLYLLFAVVSFYFIFDIASLYLPPPLNLAAVFAAAYPFVYGAVAYWFTFPEFWGMAFFLFGMWGLFKKINWIMALGFSMACLIREFYIISWLGVLGVMLFNRESRQKIYFMAAPAPVFAIAFLFHFLAIEGVQKTSLPGPALWFAGKPAHLLQILSFGSVLLSGGAAAVGIALVVFLAGVYLNRKQPEFTALSASVLLPAVLFLKIGPGAERIYWGAVFLPLMMASAVMGLGFFVEKPYGGKGVEEDSMSDIFTPGRGERDADSVNSIDGEDGAKL